MNHLFIFNIQGNILTLIRKHTFYHLSGEVKMLVTQPEICECYTSVNVSCSAVDKRSPYLTCDRLLSDRILMGMMWLIGLNAISGNLFVLSLNNVIQKKNTVQAFFLTNLAISDLLMGIYMLLIASADIYFGEYFPMQAEIWRSGITCRIAGALSILSSEGSVFFVTLISIDRLIHIRYPFSRRKLGKRSSIILLYWCGSFHLFWVLFRLVYLGEITNSTITLTYVLGFPWPWLNISNTLRQANGCVPRMNCSAIFSSPCNRDHLVKSVECFSHRRYFSA